MEPLVIREGRRLAEAAGAGDAWRKRQRAPWVALIALALVAIAGTYIARAVAPRDAGGQAAQAGAEAQVPGGDVAGARQDRGEAASTAPGEDTASLSGVEITNASALDRESLGDGAAAALGAALASWGAEAGEDTSRATVSNVSESADAVDVELICATRTVRLSWDGSRWAVGSATAQADTLIRIDKDKRLAELFGEGAQGALRDAWAAFCDSRGMDSGAWSADVNITGMSRDAAGDLTLPIEYLGKRYTATVPVSGAASISENE